LGKCYRKVLIGSVREFFGELRVKVGEATFEPVRVHFIFRLYWGIIGVNFPKKNG